PMMIVLVPWAVLVLGARWIQLSQERYIAFQVPFIFTVIAAGWTTLELQKRRVAAALAAATLSFALAAYYGAPGSLFGYRLRYAKEDWPGAAAFIRKQRTDVVVVSPGYLSIALDRYSLGKAREAPTSATPSDPANVSGERTALVISHGGPAEERLRAAFD